MLFNRKPVAATPPPVEPPKPEPVVEPPVVETAPPNYVPKEDFDKLQATIYQLQDNVTNFFMKQNAPAGTPPPPIQIEDVSDEDYADAIAGSITDKHKAASIVQKRHTAIAKRENLALQQQVNQLQSVGMGAIGNLTQQGVQSLPHYKTYKKEIDTAISQLPPEARVNAEALKGVYNYIVGGHVDEILAAEREVTLRQAAPKPDTGVPGARSNSAGVASPDIPAPKDILDPLALAMIRDKYGGVGPDAIEKFVKSQRFDSWDAYYTKVYKPFETTEGNA